jgi:hypothetical protein
VNGLRKFLFFNQHHPSISLHDDDNDYNDDGDNDDDVMMMMMSVTIS